MNAHILLEKIVEYEKCNAKKFQKIVDMMRNRVYGYGVQLMRF